MLMINLISCTYGILADQYPDRVLPKLVVVFILVVGLGY
jgi:hypothetical protein